MKFCMFILLPFSLLISCAQQKTSHSINPLILKSSEAKWINIGRGDVYIIVPSEHTNDKWALLERTETPGFQTDLHKHNNMDEAFYVLSGTLSVFLNDSVYTLDKGSYVLIPKGTPHAQANLTSDTTRILSFFTPGGFEKFALARAEITKKHGSNTKEYTEAVYEVLKQHDMEILGPAPFKNLIKK